MMMTPFIERYVLALPVNYLNEFSQLSYEMHS